MPESTRPVAVVVEFVCCGRPVRLEAPLRLVTDDEDGAALVLDKVAAARAVRLHVEACTRAGGDG